MEYTLFCTAAAICCASQILPCEVATEWWSKNNILHTLRLYRYVGPAFDINRIKVAEKFHRSHIHNKNVDGNGKNDPIPIQIHTHSGWILIYGCLLNVRKFRQIDTIDYGQVETYRQNSFSIREYSLHSHTHTPNYDFLKKAIVSRRDNNFSVE